MIQTDDIIKLKIDSVSSDSNGVGRYEGMTVFVPNTVRGDVILASVVKVNKTYAFARIEKIITPSPYRTEGDCPICLECGGCAYRHMTYEEELRVKHTAVCDALRRIGSVDCPVLPVMFSETERYRNKAQYPVRSEEGQIKAGFFARRTHKVIPCDDCKLEPEEFSLITKAVIFFMQQHKIAAYDERTLTGIVRHIYLRKSSSSGEIHLCLVINSDKFPKKNDFVKFITSVNKNISGISLNFNNRDTNVILSDRQELIYGKNCITDTLCEKTFNISPLSFYQVNHSATEILYGEVKRLLDLKPGETLVDLYCGIGTIGICAAQKSTRLIGAEVVLCAVENATENARLNGMKNAHFYYGTSAKLSRRFKAQGIKADAVTVDPPRKGLDGETIENIVSFGAQRIVYVSCNPATLARDLAAFSKLGYKAALAQPVDMFPRTTHIETVVLLNKENN